MKKYLVLISLMTFLLIGCQLDEHQNDDLEVVQTIDDYQIGYITDYQKGMAMVINEIPNTEYQMLDATEIKYEPIAIGSRVKYIYEGDMAMSYPALYGIRILDIDHRVFGDAISTETEIIKIIIDDLNKKKQISLPCINKVTFENGLWIIRVIEDDFNQLTYYDYFVYDASKTIKEILIIADPQSEVSEPIRLFDDVENINTITIRTQMTPDYPEEKLLTSDTDIDAVFSFISEVELLEVSDEPNGWQFWIIFDGYDVSILGSHMIVNGKTYRLVQPYDLDLLTIYQMLNAEGYHYP